METDVEVRHRCNAMRVGVVQPISLLPCIWGDVLFSCLYAICLLDVYMSNVVYVPVYRSN